jgi:uncharacterized membrane protein
MAKPRGTLRKAFAYVLLFLAFLFTLAWMGGGYDAGMWLFSALVFGGVAWAILRGTRRDAEENEGAERSTASWRSSSWPKRRTAN